MSSVNQGKIVIYGCGGTGIANASPFEKYRNKDTPNGYGQIVPVYIDTTEGDLTESLPRDHIFVFEGLDGSGKVRAENSDVIKENTNKILQHFKPGDLNIVVSSGSGGTGPTVAGYLTIELLKRKVPVVVITVGTRDSRVEIENTIKTLQTYEKAAHITKMPVVMSYFQNDETTPREKVDAFVNKTITSLSALFSRQHKRLDTADLANWLNYPKINPNIGPRLVLMDLLDKSQLQTNERDVLSIATLAKEGQDTSPGTPVEYQAVGYVEPQFQENIHFDNPLHFCVIDNLVPAIFANLEKELAAFNEHRRAKPASKPVAKFGEDEDDDIVL